MPKVYSPNPAFNGRRGDIVFKDGVADVADDDPQMRVMRKHGYGIGERPQAMPVPVDELPVHFDGHVTQGEPLRDAAVDPKPEDYLAPINAGKANPHSPEVVAPEIHHDGPAGLKPGEVHVDDPAAQEADEKALAKAVLVDNMDKGEAVAQAAGPDENDTEDDGTPKRSASKATWVAYAVALGADEGEAEAMSRNDLVEKYG